MEEPQVNGSIPGAGVDLEALQASLGSSSTSRRTAELRILNEKLETSGILRNTPPIFTGDLFKFHV